MNAALKDAVPHYESMQKVDPLPVEVNHSLAKSNPNAAQRLAKATGLATRAQGRAWIIANFETEATQKQLLAEYETQIDLLGKQRVQDLQADYDKVRGWI